LTGKALFDTNPENAKSFWQEAIHFLERAITLSPQFAEAYAFIGLLYLYPYVDRAQGFSKARQHFERALQLDPNQSIAKEGMRLIALRSSPVSEKERYFKEVLNNLARVTRSGIKFSVLSVEIKDSPLNCDLFAELAVKNVSRRIFTDTVKVMKYLGGIGSLQRSDIEPSDTIGAIIRLVGEVSGMTVSAIYALQIDIDRVGIVFRLTEEGPTCTIFTPTAILLQYKNKRISQKQLFSSMTYIEQ